MFFTFEENGQKKAINEKGEVISFDYSNIGESLDGLLVVQKGEVYNIGIINSLGEEVVPVSENYSHVSLFPQGVASVKKRENGKSALIFIEDCKRVVKEIECDLAVGSSNGLIVVKKDGQFGVLDSLGNEVVGFGKYEQIQSFSDGFAVVRKGEQFGIIDKEGNEVVAFGTFSEIQSYANGFAEVKKGNEKGFIDRSGRELKHFGKYDSVKVLSEDLIAVKKGSSWEFGIIDKNGKFKKVKAGYDEIRPFSENSMFVRQNNSWFVVDRAGKKLSQQQYEAIEQCDGEFAIVKKGKSMAYIHKSGKEVIEIAKGNYDFLSKKCVTADRIDSYYRFLADVLCEKLPLLSNEEAVACSKQLNYIEDECELVLNANPLIEEGNRLSETEIVSE